jgi:RHS repeat-associated protein
MKTTTYHILLALAVLFFSIETADACSLNPTAVITTDPDARVLYNGEPVLLSGENSVANCGFIDQYRWRARPVGGSYITLYQGSSPTYNLTVPLLNDGETERLYEIELRVRNSSNLYHTRTIQVTVTRNNKSFYYLTDHLGSVRVTVDERGDPVGWDDYYPFGLQMPGRSQQQYGSPLTDVKYTGYELNQEGGLGLYHAGARLYDPEIGRFMQQDRFKVRYPSLTPYQYAANNPVLFIDVNGDTIYVDESMAENEALAAYLSSNEGFAFASQFAYEGQIITVAGQTFTFENAGRYSTQNINYIGVTEGGNKTEVINSIFGNNYVSNEGVQSYNIMINTRASFLHQAAAIYHETLHPIIFALRGADARGNFGPITREAVDTHHRSMLTPTFFEPKRTFLQNLGADGAFITNTVGSLMWQAGIRLGEEYSLPPGLDRYVTDVKDILLREQRHMRRR